MIVHPVMGLMGGGERLCCETIRVLLSTGHEITMISEAFDKNRVERFFGYNSLFDGVDLWAVPIARDHPKLGTTSHLIHYVLGQNRLLKKSQKTSAFDLVFSTQDAGYIPSLTLPVIQWGYFPRHFPRHFLHPIPGHVAGTLFETVRSLPLRLYYKDRISRVGLVLAISEYSRLNLDREWKRPSVIVSPPCNMVRPRTKHDVVITVARGHPVKRLDLFWKIANQRPMFEFILLLTPDPTMAAYSTNLIRETPPNGRTILNPDKEIYHELLGKAKVYLHLAENEHFGIALVEAMSAGCVPVVHDSGGPKEIVEDNVGFRWQTVEDIPVMVDKAMKISPSETARLRAKNFSTQQFDSTLSLVLNGLR